MKGDDFGDCVVVRSTSSFVGALDARCDNIILYS